MLQGLRSTSVPVFIMIQLTVWPQYTNVTDRTDNGLIAYGKPFYKQSPKYGSCDPDCTIVVDDYLTQLIVN